jgi:MAC/Perforin domain
LEEKLKLAKLITMFLVIIVMAGNLPAQTQSPGLDVLGFGYDVFGNYADQKSKSRYCLFQYGNYSETPIGTDKYNVPQYVILENISDHIMKTVSGSSRREYSKNLSKKAGMEVDAMFFSASVNGSYSTSTSGSEQKFYYTYMDANTKWRISFDERSLSELSKILDPQFRKDLNSMEPRKLFETYGTHFIARAYLGGRADFTSVSTITSKTNTTEIGLAVEAKYNAVSANTEMNSKNKQTLSNSKTTTKLRVTGGNSEYANNISDPATYKLWADGIEGRPVLCDFDENSLKPIWIFCADSGRRAVLETEFDKMCSEKPLPKYVGNSTSPQLIVSKFNINQVIHIKGGKTDLAGSKVLTWDLSIHPAQQFYFEETKVKNEFKLRTQGGLYLVPEGNKDRSGITIDKEGDQSKVKDKDNNQAGFIWIKEDAGSGYFRLKNKKADLYITIEGNKPANGSRLMINTKKDISGQKWKTVSKDSVLGTGKTVYDEKWSSGWTTTKILDIKNAKYLFHQKKGKGWTNNEAIINAKGKITLTKAYDKTWSEGWSEFTFFKYKDNTYHLAMKTGTGNASVNQYDFQGKPAQIYSEEWSSGWSHFETIYVGKQPYFLHYKKNSGLTRIGKLTPKPDGNVWETTWPKNISSFSYYRAGKRDFLFFVSLEGKAWIFEIKKSGDKLTLSKTWSTSDWEANINKSLVMEFSAGPILFLSKQQTGKVWYFVLTSDGKVGKKLRESTWSTGWSDFDTWTENNKTYFLHHKESGQTKINEYSW